MVELAPLAIEPSKQAHPIEAAKPQSPSAIVSIDLNGSITAVNPLAVQTLGYSQEHIIGTHFSRFLLLSHLDTAPLSDTDSDDPIASSVAEGRAVRPVYGLLRRADSSSFEPFEVSISPIYYDGVLAGAILIIDGADLRTNPPDGAWAAS